LALAAATILLTPKNGYRYFSIPVRALKDLGVDIFVCSQANSTVNVGLRRCCHCDDGWPLYFHTVKAVEPALDQHGMTMSFTQRDLYSSPP
jgi:hypothetical protein